MSLRSVDSIERSVHKTNEWLKDLTAGSTTTTARTPGGSSRPISKPCATELTVDEAAQLAAQLPLVLRGAFYDGFDPSGQPAKLRHRDEFLARLAQRARLPDPEDAARAAEAATKVLRRHVTEGELDDVLSQLPTEVRQVLAHS